MRPVSTAPTSSRRSSNSLPPRSRLTSGEPAEPGGLSSEAIKKLQQLAELHEQNVLSDEEFEREKAKLLGG